MLYSTTQIIGKNIIYQPKCASTQTVAKQLIETSLPQEGTVIITDHQYQGKGQGKNQWLSLPNKNLTFSLILYPTFLAAYQIFNLNIAVSLAIHSTLIRFTDDKLKIKWPNDIYYDNKKIGGILIDTKIQKNSINTAIIGVGLNINQKKFNNLNATSLACICLRSFIRSILLTELLANFENYYKKLKQGVYLKKLYIDQLHWYQELHTFQDKYNKFQGIIINVDNMGKLVIKSKFDQIKKFDQQEIIFVT